jgi:alpha-tubulin suppressor-like RCC1 family protein
VIVRTNFKLIAGLSVALLASTASERAVAATPTSVAPKREARFVSIGAGLIQLCAINAEARVTCAGNNKWGSLGDFTTSDRATPVAVQAIADAKQVIGGGNAMCALTKSGTVACWGDNRFGIIGTGGSIAEEGQNRIPAQGLNDATQISVEGPHVCALTRKGTVKCWGYNTAGQVGDGTVAGDSPLGRALPVAVEGVNNATQVDVGATNSCARVASGDVLCWGDNSSKQLGGGNVEFSPTPVRVPLTSAASQIAIGSYFGCALVEKGNVVCWGGGKDGKVVKVSGLSDATSIAASAYGACAIRRNSTVSCWGMAMSLPSLAKPTPLGTTATTVSGWSNVKQLAGGLGFMCALTTAGRISCAGDNMFGQFGNGTKTSSTNPTPAFGS